MTLPATGAIIEGPYWNGPAEVLGVRENSGSVRLQLVQQIDGVYRDLTLTLDEYPARPWPLSDVS